MGPWRKQSGPHSKRRAFDFASQGSVDGLLFVHRPDYSPYRPFDGPLHLVFRGQDSSFPAIEEVFCDLFVNTTTKEFSIIFSIGERGDQLFEPTDPGFRRISSLVATVTTSSHDFLINILSPLRNICPHLIRALGQSNPKATLFDVLEIFYLFAAPRATIASFIPLSPTIARLTIPYTLSETSHAALTRACAQFRGTVPPKPFIPFL